MTLDPLIRRAVAPLLRLDPAAVEARLAELREEANILESLLHTILAGRRKAQQPPERSPAQPGAEQVAIGKDATALRGHLVHWLATERRPAKPAVIAIDIGVPAAQIDACLKAHRETFRQTVDGWTLVSEETSA
jgi:hypothetical protein